MPERTLTVKIVGDDRSLQKAFKDSAKSGQTLQTKVSGVGPAIAKGFLAAGAGVLTVQTAFKVLGDSVDQASAINEEVSKSKQIFGDSSKAIVQWSDTTATAMGVSKREALEATGIFGNLFRTVGLAPQQSAAMSRSLVQLAADLASFNNANPSDVLEALRSGLIGEAEPLRRFGVLLSESRVQQRAMADTGKTTATALTNQEKALARYEIILQDTTKAQGDFARTSGGLANQQRILAANVADLEGKFGTVLLPTLVEVVHALNLMAAGAEKFQAALDKIHFPTPPKWVLGAAGLFEISPLAAYAVAIGHIAGAFDSATSSAVKFNTATLQPGQLPGLDTLPGFPVLPAVPTPKPKPVPDPFGPLKEQDARRRRQALEASREHRRAQHAFDAFVKGMGLKLDNDAITASLGDDLRDLRILEAAILRRISVEGRTFDLVQQLTDVRSRIASTTAEQAANAKQKSDDAFDAIIDSLNLNLERAQATRGFNDDLRALKELETAILKRIAAEGRTTDLLRRLFENRQAQAQALNDARNAAQFEALGLTAEGDKPVAGRRALLRRAQSLREQLKGTVFDTPKTRRELDRIVAVLTDKTKAVGRTVRAAILSMLDEISSPLKGEQTGPLTTFAKRGVEQLVRGLGLTESQTKEVRQRFAQFGRLDLAPGGGSRPPGRTATPLPGDRGPAEPDGRITVNVYIDGQKVEGVVTRRQQKKRGRNAPQRRGVRPGA